MYENILNLTRFYLYDTKISHFRNISVEVLGHLSGFYLYLFVFFSYQWSKFTKKETVKRVYISQQSK